MLKCEFINRIVAIPQCIWCNFTGDDDYCRWVIYDTERKDEECGGACKIFGESYGFRFQKLCFFNYDRGGELTFEIIVPELTATELENILELARSYSFIDYTDKEKEEIRLQYANHKLNCSLMCHEACSHEEKLAILDRLVHLVPHPKDERGQYMPMISVDGQIVPWPKDENGDIVHVSKLPC